MKGVRVLILLTILALLGSCSGHSAEELYCLPEANKDYYDLQTALSGALSEGYSYHAPASGVRREPVQLVDLDSDGIDEAVAFLRNSQKNSVVVYIFSKTGDVYETADVIECSGSVVGSVEYADLNGDQSLELLITTQVSEAVTQALQVFRYTDETAAGILTAPCGKYYMVDLDGNGIQELLCLTDSGADAPGAVSYYSLQEENQETEPELSLSGSYASVLNVKQGKLSDGSGAVVMTIDGGDQIITDVFVREETGLRAVDAGDVLQTDRIRGSILPEDINGDGFLEIPKATLLRQAEEGTGYWAVSWYGLSCQGEATEVMRTYHDLTENWYLELPEAWWGKVTVVEDEETKDTVTFRRLTQKGTAGEEILTIYTLKGENRQEEAEERGLTILASDADRILAVSIREKAKPWEGSVVMSEVSERFHLEGQAEND